MVGRLLLYVEYTIEKTFLLEKKINKEQHLHK